VPVLPETTQAIETGISSSSSDRAVRRKSRGQFLLDLPLSPCLSNSSYLSSSSADRFLVCRSFYHGRPNCTFHVLLGSALSSCKILTSVVCAISVLSMHREITLNFLRIETRSPAVAKIADRTGCQWFLRSSKVNDFHVIWKPICDFLSTITSNLGHIMHRLATIHPWQTDDRQTTTTTIARPLLKYGRLRKLIKSYVADY